MASLSRTPRRSSNSRPWAEFDAQTRSGVRRDGTEVGNQSGELRPSVAEGGLKLVGGGSPDEAPEGLDDRCVWSAPRPADAATHEDNRAALGGEIDERADQAGLADARLTCDEGRAAASLLGLAEGRAQPGKIALTTDQDRAGDARRHVPDYQASHPAPSAADKRTLAEDAGCNARQDGSGGPTGVRQPADDPE